MSRTHSFIIMFFLSAHLIGCGTDTGVDIPTLDDGVVKDTVQVSTDTAGVDLGSSEDLCDEAKSRMAADPCLVCLCDEEGQAVCEGVQVGAPCTIEDCCYQNTYCSQCAAGDDSCLDSGLVCTGTPDIECVNDNECMQSFPVCTESTCTCSEAPVEPGSPCIADSNACTVGDFCAEGECIQSADAEMDNGNPCTVGICVKGEIIQQMLEGQCSDGNPCTIEEECKLGQCVAEKLRECPLTACAQTAFCDSATGECDVELKPDGSPCLLEDNLCGSDGRCEAGECIPIGNELEICDGIDNDCDGLTDEDQPLLQCGNGDCYAEIPGCVDGVAQVCVAVEGTPEICDGIDNDCDGQTDEDLGQLTCGVEPCTNTVDACMNGTEQWCLPQFNCCPNGMLDAGEECDDGDLEDDDWCNNQCKETGQNCDDEDPISTSFMGIDNTSVGVGTWCNFGCFAYWSSTLDDIAWAWVCNGEIFVCPLGLTDCTGGCPDQDGDPGPQCIAP